VEYTAIIEMPKGETRRIHLSYNSEEGFLDLGPIKEQIPVNEGVMPIHYGYIEHAINREEKDNVDVLVYSALEYKTGDRVPIEILGMLNRKDGDHKVLARDSSVNVGNFYDFSQSEQMLILEYFGFKSAIVSIDDKEAALAYLQACGATQDSLA